MFDTCYLHIGTEKTGSTSIQQFLARNRTVLRQRGFLYPATFGLPNNTGLAIYAAAPNMLGGITLGTLDPGEDLPAWRARVADRFREEVAGLPHDIATLLLSNEHLHSRLMQTEEIASLRDLLAPYVRRFRIVVYLRRQDRVAVSAVSTRIKAGATQVIALPKLGPRSSYFYDYARVIDNYAAVFGEAACEVRLFEAARFAGGDLISDFAAAVGIDQIEGLARPQVMNKSLTALGQRILRELNRHLPAMVDGKLNPLRGDLVQALTQSYAGHSHLATRDEARAFVAQFRESNSTVRRRFFPDLGRPTLFDEDFSSYPETVEETDPGFPDACEAAARLWIAQRRVIIDQAARIKRQEAQIATTRARASTDIA